MSDGDAGGIGARVATLRKLQGLKQHQFATKAHLSISLVKKVESGHAPASPAFAAASARALGVEVSALTGQPYDDTTADAAADHAAIPELRRALDSHDAPEIDGPILSAAELRAQLDDGESLRRRSRYSDLAARLPELLYHAYAITAEAAQGAELETASALLDDGYALAHAVAYNFGYIDLAALVADRGEMVAPLSGDPLRVSVATFRRSHLQLHRGDYDLGTRVVGNALDVALEERSPKALPWRVNCICVKRYLPRGPDMPTTRTLTSTKRARLSTVAFPPRRTSRYGPIRATLTSTRLRSRSKCRTAQRR